MLNGQPSMRIEISMTANGDITVSGPFMNKPVFLFMLEFAKNQMWEFDPNKQPGVIVAQQELPRFR